MLATKDADGGGGDARKKRSHPSKAAKAIISEAAASTRHPRCGEIAALPPADLTDGAIRESQFRRRLVVWEAFCLTFFLL